MLFKSNIRETPLTQAVLSNDFQTLEQLGKYRDQVLAENDLKYNALELAEYLGKKECLKYLQPSLQRDFKVIGTDGQLHLLNEAAFEEFFNIKYLSRFKFSNYSFFQKVLRCRSRVFTTELFAEDPLQLGKKYREGIVSGTFADVTIRWINDRVGWGVFTERDLEANVCIGEYVGVINQVYRFREYDNTYCLLYPKMIWEWERFVIDSKYEGNEARFLNHSSNPNLVVKMAVDRNLIHPLFFTNKPIPKGTQLTFDYGKNYWRHRGEPDLID
jgi:hypothetical protein